MRTRITILCGFLLFSVLSVTPAQAGPWSAFIAWLSDMDPKTRGVGVEIPLFCTPATTDPTTKDTSRFACVRNPNQSRLVVKTSASFLLGTLNSSGGTMFATPVLGIVEKQTKHVFVGAGAGVMHVGGTLKGGITRGLVQVSVTYPVPKIQLGIRAELNVIAKGFPAGTFSPGSAASGTEALFGLSFVYLR